MKTKTVILCAVCAAIICVFSLITINIGTVPITLSLFAIFLVPVILGAKKGVISVAVYLLLGAVGLPVFAGFNGGFQRLIGPTGGYLWSYLIMALIIGALTSKLPKSKGLALLKIFAACAAALVLCYALGTAQYMLVMNQGLGGSLAVCVAPFVVFDLIKAAAASYIGYETRRALLKANLLE